MKSASCTSRSNEGWNTRCLYLVASYSQEIFGSTLNSSRCYITVTRFTTTVGLIVSTAEFLMDRFLQISWQGGLRNCLLPDWICLLQILVSDAIIKHSVPVLVILQPIIIAIVMIVIVNKFVALSNRACS